MNRSALIGVILAAGFTTLSAGQTLAPLGDLPGGVVRSEAFGVSASGGVVVGSSSSTASTGTFNEAFRWSDSLLFEALGDVDVPSNVNSVSNAVSADGSVVVGNGTSGTASLRAFVWEGGPLTQLDFSGWDQSEAYDVSADGATIVGRLRNDFTGEWPAVRWDRISSVYVPTVLGHLAGVSLQRTLARGVSADGTVVVGQSGGGSGRAFRWTQAGGIVEITNQIGGSIADAYDVSVDTNGTIHVVGSARDAGSIDRAFRWRSDTGMMVSIQSITPSSSSIATAISGDGEIVVGTMGTGSGSRAFIWDETNGMRQLDGLPGLDNPLTGLVSWTSQQATDISPDGLTIVGSGQNPSGNIEAWRVTLPPPNLPPSADAVVEQLTSIGNDALVRLDASGSSDPDDASTELTYRWTIDTLVECEGDQSTCEIIDVALAFGEHEVTLRVTDPGGLFSEVTTLVTLDPASLSVLALSRAEVCFNKEKIELVGEIGLPPGVDFAELSPDAGAEIAVGGVEALAFTNVGFTTHGANGRHWDYEDGSFGPGIRRFEIDWRGSRYRFHDHGFPVDLQSDFITSSETLLEIRLRTRRIDAPFTIDIDGLAQIEFDSDGAVTNATAPYQTDDPGRRFTLTLPFPLTSTSVITFTGGLEQVVDVGADLRTSVGRFRLKVDFDGGLFPDGVATDPRTLHLGIAVGAQCYPGEVLLGPGDLRARGKCWHTYRNCD